jgi:alkyldihydroxyacetonephosphate synthase
MHGAPTAPAQSLRWWSWGEVGRGLPPEQVQRVKDYLLVRLGAPPEAGGPGPVPTSALKLPPGRLTPEDVAGLRALLSLGAVSVEGEERLVHSYGRSYQDLLSLRSGRLHALTDGVVHPGTAEEVAQVLRFAEDRDLAVVPFGGGTSLVGGVDPLPGAHRAVLTLSLERMVDPLSVDEVGRLARFQAGIRGPELERYLNERGFTLGHFPQSFERSTLGGWVATRSSGDAVRREGELSQWLRGITVVTPAGTLRFEEPLPEATGPDPFVLFPGSEGTLGVIVEVTVAVRKRPEETLYRGTLFPNWESGVEAGRELAQGDLPPFLFRLTDSEGTALTLEGRGPGPGISGRVRERIEPRYLEFKHFDPGTMCLALQGWEGTSEEVSLSEREARRVAREHGGLDLGRAFTEFWRRERFAFPHLRDELVEAGWMVETLETAAPWSELTAVALGARQALEERARAGRWSLLVATHLSHVTPAGASLNFQLIAPRDPEDPSGQARGLVEAGLEAVVRAGGKFSHHLGVGRDRLRLLSRQRSEVETVLLTGLKRALDPRGILNPGKTLPLAERPSPPPKA